MDFVQVNIGDRDYLVEYSVYAGTTPAGGDDPSELSITSIINKGGEGQECLHRIQAMTNKITDFEEAIKEKLC